MTINVRGIANAAIQSVNKNIEAPYRQSTGYTTSPSGKRDPSFAPAVTASIQVQAATSEQLKHVENLNLQSIYRNVRMWGNALGVSRPDVRGGDLFEFPQVPMGTPQTWLVVTVLESWPTWCSVIVVLQNDPVTP